MTGTIEDRKGPLWLLNLLKDYLFRHYLNNKVNLPKSQAEMFVKHVTAEVCSFPIEHLAGYLFTLIWIIIIQ